jgi:hypothetical protein
MDMKSFDRPTARTLGSDTAKALQAFAQARGLTVEYAGGSLNGPQFIMKLKFGIEGLDKGEMDFKKYAKMVGLEESDLGAKITLNGKMFTVSGYRPGARTKTVEIRDITGKLYVTTVWSVRNALGRKD